MREKLKQALRYKMLLSMSQSIYCDYLKIICTACGVDVEETPLINMYTLLDQNIIGLVQLVGSHETDQYGSQDDGQYAIRGYVQEIIEYSGICVNICSIKFRSKLNAKLQYSTLLGDGSMYRVYWISVEDVLDCLVVKSK